MVNNIFEIMFPLIVHKPGFAVRSAWPAARAWRSTQVKEAKKH